MPLVVKVPISATIHCHTHLHVHNLTRPSYCNEAPRMSKDDINPRPINLWFFDPFLVSVSLSDFTCSLRFHVGKLFFETVEILSEVGDQEIS